MKVIITSKNFNASDHLKETIEKKFERLGKYFSEDAVANITLAITKERQTVEATINAPGTIFRAEETDTDMYNAVDSVIGKLSTQMSRFKTKLQKKHKGDIGVLFSELPEEKDGEEEEIRIARRKKFDIIPMTAEEAVMQMELLAHNFFVFLNPDSANVNIVYKRKDGSFGLLEPKY